MDWSQCSVVETNENIVGGAPVIIGTRIPLSAVFENLEGGATISEIVEWFPGITEAQIREILKIPRTNYVEIARSNWKAFSRIRAY